MSVGRIRSVITPNVGPASIALTIRKVVAPVTSSPAQIACWTGAAPRQAGSTEKCRLTQPCARDVEGALRQQRAVGDDRAAVGRQVAQRGLEVGVARVVGLEHRQRRAPRRAGATGLATSLRPRPDGRVGTGDDADELVAGWPRSASREGTATSGVPAKTTRIRGRARAWRAG